MRLRVCVCVTQDRRTPLHFAARVGNLEVCEYLLDRGAERDAVDVVSPRHPFIRTHTKVPSLIRDGGRAVFPKLHFSFPTVCVDHNALGG